MRFELSSIQSGSGVYTGSLAGLKLWERWDFNSSESAKYLLNFQSGSKRVNSTQSLINKGYTLTTSVPSGYGKSVLNALFISPVIDSGVLLSDLYSGQCKCLTESPNTGYFNSYGYLTVMGATGQKKATVATFSGPSLYSTGNVNKTISQNFVDSSYTFNGTERLVVELGTQTLNNNTGTFVFKQTFGAVYTGDLPVDNTSTLNKNPWFGFSDSIV